MTPHLATGRRILTVVALTVVWCALWGQFSVANIVSGALLAGLLDVTGVRTAGGGRIRVGPLLRFAGLVIYDLAASTAAVAKSIVIGTDRTDEAIVAVHLPVDAGRHVLLLVVAITLTPGTAVVDADADTGTVYLHLLQGSQAPSVTRHVQHLARLACQAFPVPGGQALLVEDR